MSRIAFNKAEVRRKHLRREYVPIVSTILASLLALLPIIVSSPVIPDFAFLMLIAWRLLRPEMWGPGRRASARACSTTRRRATRSASRWRFGRCSSSSSTSSTAGSVPRLLDGLADRRRCDHAYIFADWYIGTLMGNQADFSVMLPQLAASVLAFPVVARFVLLLDRWRLAR
jgi:rod shape-determining protein MreD